VDELLLLSSVRKQDVYTYPISDMDAIVGSVLRRLADTLMEHHAQVSQPDTWPVALGYGPWVEEVWTNYVSNAVKYGGVPPRIELGASAGKNGMVRFWVRDNGQGLTAEEQARLFTPFTRLHQVQLEGHGLGLSIVRRIVEKSDGQVGVESSIGEGSLFYFELPAAGNGANGSSRA
jgi:signal transduction histidine kinase